MGVACPFCREPSKNLNELAGHIRGSHGALAVEAFDAGSWKPELIERLFGGKRTGQTKLWTG